MRHRVTQSKQQGLGLVSAIFVIVILAIVTIGMNTILTNSQTFRAQETLATRALMAAHTRVELHLSEIMHPENGGSCVSDASQVSITTSGLNDCTYQAICSSVTISSQIYYTVESTGRCGAGADSASRIVKVRVAP